MGDVLTEALSILGGLPHLFPDEKARVRAALERGDDATRGKILGKLRAARDEYAVNGGLFEKAAAAAFERGAAKLRGARHTAAKARLERTERADRDAEGPVDDLLAGL